MFGTVKGGSLQGCAARGDDRPSCRLKYGKPADSPVCRREVLESDVCAGIRWHRRTGVGVGGAVRRRRSDRRQKPYGVGDVGASLDVRRAPRDAVRRPGRPGRPSASAPSAVGSLASTQLPFGPPEFMYLDVTPGTCEPTSSSEFVGVAVPIDPLTYCCLPPRSTMPTNHDIRRRLRRAAILGSAILACRPDPSTGDESTTQATTDGADTTPSTTPTAASSTADTSSTTMSADTSSSHTSTEDSTTGEQCPEAIPDCELGAQDCPDDGKCLLSYLTGVGGRNVCAPFPPSPRAEGETCTPSLFVHPRYGEVYNDDCDAGLACDILGPEPVCLRVCTCEQGDARCEGTDACGGSCVPLPTPDLAGICAPLCDPKTARCTVIDGAWRSQLFPGPIGDGEPCAGMTDGCASDGICVDRNTMTPCGDGASCECRLPCDSTEPDACARRGQYTCAPIDASAICPPLELGVCIPD